ncbi:MAG TPA: hypothetical protein VHZ52_10160 [Acidobacteriaceae bacterium]|jgi:hypothetical protein|nr:hypothetical protein [Acidobacteriaceae bacterium]
MAASMRPLTLGEILDRTVQLYRRNFLLFVGISFLPSAAYVILSGSASVYLNSHLPNTAPGATPNLQAMLTLGLFGLAFFLIGVPLLLGITAVVLGSLTQAATLRNRGEAAAIGEAYGYAFRHFFRHAGIIFLQLLFAVIIPMAVFAVGAFGAAMVAALLARSAAQTLGIIVGLGIILMVVAVLVVCVWIWLRYCLAFAASITEQKKAWPSMQRSASLSKGTRGRIFVMYLMVVILTVIAYYAITLPIDLVLKFTLYKSMAGIALLTKPPLVLQIVNLFVSCLERTFVLPIYAIALVLFYNDQRTRKEGYDIEILMDQAGWAHMPPPVPPASPAYVLPPAAPIAQYPVPAEMATAPSAATEPAPPIPEPHPSPPAPSSPAPEASGA